MGQRYLIDSNILIDYTASRLPLKGSDFVEQIFETDFLISVIAKIEVLGFDDLPHKIRLMEDFVNTAIVLPLNEDITTQTILLRKKRKLKLGDAIIAGTALVHNLTIVTRNSTDFKNIEKLNILNPWEI